MYFNEGRTWEEQLALPSSLTTESETFKEPLRTCANLIVKDQQGGLLQAFNSISPLELDLTLNENPHFTWVAFHVPRPYATPGRGKGPIQQSYTDIYHAFVEWSQILCEVLGPLFGLGYQDENDAATELFVSGGAELLQGRLPDIDAWFKVPPLRYLAPQLLTNERLLDLLKQPHWQVQRLSTGGIFVVPRHPAYTYQASAGHLYRSLATEKWSALAEMEKGNTPKADQTTIERLSREARAEAKHALGIFQAIGDQEGARAIESFVHLLEHQTGELLKRQP